MEEGRTKEEKIREEGRRNVSEQKNHRNGRKRQTKEQTKGQTE